MNIDLLPADCLAHILSCTSPGDACRLSLVSSTVRFAADSDNVWETFLPADYQEILSRLVLPLEYFSKKELFMRLCTPVLIDQGGGTNMNFSLKLIHICSTACGFKFSLRDCHFLELGSTFSLNIILDEDHQQIDHQEDEKTFSLEKSTSKKRYMLSARELSITWANNPLYWTWKPLLQSRFAEVAELRTISWLEITGEINTETISPKTQYAAYLIVKFAERAFGLDSLPSEVSLEVGNGSLKSQGTVYLRWQERKKQLQCLGHVYFLHRVEALRSRVFEGDSERFASEREDGWVEIELGSFYNDGGDGKVKMCLKEVKGQHLKGGLIVEGIEIRPKE